MLKCIIWICSHSESAVWLRSVVCSLYTEKWHLEYLSLIVYKIFLNFCLSGSIVCYHEAICKQRFFHKILWSFVITYRTKTFIMFCFRGIPLEVLHAIKVFVLNHIQCVKDRLIIACFSMYVFILANSQFVISFCICCRLLLWQWMSGLLLFAFLTRYVSFTFKAATVMSCIVIPVSSCPFGELGQSRTGVPKAGTDIATSSCLLLSLFSRESLTKKRLWFCPEVTRRCYIFISCCLGPHLTDKDHSVAKNSSIKEKQYLIKLLTETGFWEIQMCQSWRTQSFHDPLFSHCILQTITQWHHRGCRLIASWHVARMEFKKNSFALTCL